MGQIPKLHLANPLLLIIDTAPLFLGLFSFAIGVAVDRMVSQEKVALEEILAREKRLQAYSEDLEMRNIELNNLNVTLDGLVYTASHDLKTPVVNFQGMLKMLRKLMGRPGSEKMLEEVLDRMERATWSLHETITDLLDVTRLEKETPEEVVPLQIEEVLTEIQRSVSEMMEEKQATIEIDVASQPLVHCSRRNLDSLLQNLLTNALKYSHPDRPPIIVVRSERVGDCVVVSVQDNGLGIDLDGQGKKLFQMFSRLHSSAEGSGIGLYIVKKTMAKMGGKVTVESKVDVGTTFKLFFPHIETSSQQEKYEKVTQRNAD